MSMSQQRYPTLLGSDDISQLCSGFIRFIEEVFVQLNQILLPIAKQDTKQFQNWTKFKEIIDPFNKRIELNRVEQFFQSYNNSKANQENKPPLPILKEQTKTLNVQDRSYSIPQTTTMQFIAEDYEKKLKEITEKINKSFHQNNTHLDILLKMNDTTQETKNKIDATLNNTRNPSITRRVEYKRRNTDYYSFKPTIINI